TETSRLETEALRARATRLAETERLVRPALEEAITLRAEARAQAVIDVPKWEAALAAAQRAKAAVDAGEADDDLSQRVSQTLAQLEAEVKSARAGATQARENRQLLATLETIRFRSSQMRKGASDRLERDRDEAAVFKRYGMDVDASSAQAVADRIRARGIVEEAIPELDNWAFFLGEAFPARFEKLLAMLGVLDKNEDRRRLRAALQRQDQSALRKMAADPRILQLPSAYHQLLADGLFWH